MEELYFIVDGSGNYYHINTNGNLAVSPSRAAAAVFTFADANQRIGGGKKSHFYSVIPAVDESEEAKETNEDKNETDFQETSQDNLNNVIYVTKDISCKEADKKPELTYDMEAIDWVDYLMQFSYVAGQTTGYLEELKRRQSEVDMEICDIMHLVELYELDDEEQFATMELLRSCRERRRKIKDLLYLVECFQKSIGNSANVVKAKEGIKQMKKLDDRSYKPRKLPHIFEGKVEKKNSKELDIENENMMCEYVTEIEKKEDEYMEYVRCETVFDGKTNDWAGFVKAQTEFFANAKQYIYNLKMDLWDTDKQIENILEQIEDANYNVTQGYKVFKELKECRNRRKDIEKELECVRTIAECFNLESMVEAYEYCAETIEAITNCGEKEE